MQKTVNIAALQIASLSFDKAKLDYYLTIAKTKKCKVFVLGEYVLNLFFKELETTPLSLIKEQTRYQKKNLQQLANSYNMVIITPAIVVRNKKVKKIIYKFTPRSVTTYTQQILINYKHWDEEKFFSNPIESLKAPMTFSIDGIKIAVMAGFEIHFDYFWQQCMSKKIDCVLVPTASTFGSQNRWRHLLSTKAYQNSSYVLRINRTGTFHDKEHTWQFYGDSFLMQPNGEIESHLGTKEELMIAIIDKNIVKEHKKSWGFTNALTKRDMI
jgi:predicted amidohydrolase